MLCRRCWIMNKDCICQKAAHLQIPTSYFQHRLIIYMCVFYACSEFAHFERVCRHFKEFSRSSNTGALPQVCLDDSRISVFVKGIPSHDSQVMQMCAARVLPAASCAALRFASRLCASATCVEIDTVLKNDSCNCDGSVGNDERWSASTAINYGVVTRARYGYKSSATIYVDAGVGYFGKSSLRKEHARCPPDMYGVIDGPARVAKRRVLAVKGIDSDRVRNFSSSSSVEA